MESLSPDAYERKTRRAERLIQKIRENQEEAIVVDEPESDDETSADLDRDLGFVAPTLAQAASKQKIPNFEAKSNSEENDMKPQPQPPPAIPPPSIFILFG